MRKAKTMLMMKDKAIEAEKEKEIVKTKQYKFPSARVHMKYSFGGKKNQVSGNLNLKCNADRYEDGEKCTDVEGHGGSLLRLEKGNKNLVKT